MIKSISKPDEQERFYDAAEYERILNIRNGFERQKALDAFVREGKAAGVIGIKQMFAKYVKGKQGGQLTASNATDFDSQPMELRTGAWEATDTGILKRDAYGGEVLACTHPIMPIMRLRNIDTGKEQMILSYRRGREWQNAVVPKSVMASANAIIQLADDGIGVTSETAKHLVSYLHDVETLNYDEIPTMRSVSRLGYAGDAFIPYTDGIIFDGEASYKTLFNSVTQSGEPQEWLRVMRQLRKDSLAAHIIIAASFASVLVEPLGSLPFFVHLWGSESGTGKTVALMAAASVWGNPAIGKYIQTFHSTTVGHERLAAFLNSLPVIIDELQLAGVDNKGEKTFNVYRLAEGVGKSRGNRTGGFDRTPTWANTILTSGETPIVGENAAAGIRNRVIEIECTLGNKVVQDGHGTAAALRQNFGWGGKVFVEALDIATARQLYDCYVRQLEDNASDKQVMAAAVLLVADELATQLLFKDGLALTAEQMAAFLQTDAEIDVNQRAYDFICGWVAQNSSIFQADNKQRECYGLLEDDTVGGEFDTVYVIKTVLRDVLQRNGYSYKSVQAWMVSRGYLQKRGGNYTVQKRLNGVLTECYKIQLAHDKG